MDYAAWGDALNKMKEHKNKGTYIEEQDIWIILIQVLRGLKALHEK